MEPIFHYQRTGLAFDVYSNRVEITDKSGFGAVFSGGKTTTLLAKTITNVEIAGLTRKLSITTSDGKTVTYQLGKEGEAARHAVLSIL